MALFNLLINSKNKIYIKNFIVFFNKYSVYNQIILLKYLSKKIKKKVIVLLRSPHANKISQEKFKIENIKYSLKIKEKKSLKNLLFLKKLSNKVFSNANLKIKQLLNNKSFIKENLNIIYLINFNIGIMFINKIQTIKNFKLKVRLNFFKKNNFLISYKTSKKISQFFTSLQLCCEFFKIKLCLNSSVVRAKDWNSLWQQFKTVFKHMQQDYLSNLCASLKNGQIAKLNFLIKSRTKTCENLLKILWKEGYILGYQVLNTNNTKFKIFLKYKNNIPIINTIKKISNPGNKIFYCVKTNWKLTKNNLLIIIFTSKGMQSVTNSKKIKISGQPFIFIN